MNGWRRRATILVHACNDCTRYVRIAAEARVYFRLSSLSRSEGRFYRGVYVWMDGTAHRMSCVVAKVGSVQLRECELNYNSAAQCSDTRGRQLTSKLIGVLQMHQSSFPTWFRSLLIGQLGTPRFKAKAKGATRVGGARGCRSRNVSRIGMRTRRFRGSEQDLTVCGRQFRDSPPL